MNRKSVVVSPTAAHACVYAKKKTKVGVPFGPVVNFFSLEVPADTIGTVDGITLYVTRYHTLCDVITIVTISPSLNPLQIVA